MSFTDRIRHNSIRIGQIFKEKTGSGEASHNPRVYQRSPGERYTFDGEIRLNGMPVAALLAGDDTNIALWAGLASAIDEYRKEVWEHDSKQYSEFNGQAQGLLDLIGGKMLKVYESVTGGIRWHLSGGHLWINNINPRAVLVLFLSHPTDDRRRFLRSYLYKLDLILSGKVGNAKSYAALDQARQLREEIADALGAHAASGGVRLLSAAVG